MSAEMNGSDAAKSRSIILPVVLVLAAVAVFAYAFTTFGGIELLDRMLSGGGGGEQALAPVPPKPTEDPDEDTAPPADAVDDEVVDESVDDDIDIDEPDAGDGSIVPASSSSAQSTPNPGSTTGSSATGVTVPAEAREKMYWEQVDSQDQIGKLVAGTITSFSFTPQTSTSSEAQLRVSTAGDAPVSGTAVLRAYDGAWFFSSITRDGHTSRGPAGRTADIAVIDTIVEQQAASQAVIAAFVDGGYRTVRVNNISMGAGTATLDVELTGGTKSRSAGQIVLVSKDINGIKHWFLTSFREL